jgi:hypothetical protein
MGQAIRIIDLLNRTQNAALVPGQVVDYVKYPNGVYTNWRDANTYYGLNVYGLTLSLSGRSAVVTNYLNYTLDLGINKSATNNYAVMVADVVKDAIPRGKKIRFQLQESVANKTKIDYFNIGYYTASNGTYTKVDGYTYSSGVDKSTTGYFYVYWDGVTSANRFLYVEGGKLASNKNLFYSDNINFPGKWKSLGSYASWRFSPADFNTVTQSGINYHSYYYNSGYTSPTYTAWEVEDNPKPGGGTRGMTYHEYTYKLTKISFWIRNSNDGTPGADSETAASTRTYDWFYSCSSYDACSCDCNDSQCMTYTT